ncbi:CDP-alcohol phosphatidyltransferase family protein [Dermatophilaceae bacterium Soc4.6]
MVDDVGVGQPTGGPSPSGPGRAAVSDRVLTVPNALSALRLLGVPLFLWLLLQRHDAWAITVLVVAGATDYLDGKIARRYGLESRVGELLDPAADRLYTLTTIVAFAWRDIIPVWLLVALLARDLVMLVVVLALKRVGQTGLPVSFIGKAATFNLLYAFPILLLSVSPGTLGDVARPIGWAFTWWGLGLYWLAAALYAVQAAGLLRGPRAHAAQAV